MPIASLLLPWATVVELVAVLVFVGADLVVDGCKEMAGQLMTVRRWCFCLGSGTIAAKKNGMTLLKLAIGHGLVAGNIVKNDNRPS